MKRYFATSVLTSLAAICAVLFIASLQPARAQNQGTKDALLHLFYLGRRQSQLEPCGCHSRMQGGLQYEAVLYEQHADAPGVRLDAGDWTGFIINDRPIEALKTRYLMKGISMLQFDAVNIGPNDMVLSEEFLKTYAKENPNFIPNFVSANVFYKNRPTQHAFPASRIIKRKLADGSEVRIGITGVTSIPASTVVVPPNPNPQQPKTIETESYVARPAKECLGAVLSELRPKVDLVIVLVAGNFASGLAVAKSFPQIDYLVTTGQMSGPAVQSYQEGNVHLLGSQNVDGKEVGYLTLKRDGGKKWLPREQPVFLPVAKDVSPKAEFVALSKAFKKETQKLDVQLPGNNVKRIYSGSMYCAQCHEKEYKDWQSTRHSHAMQSLVDKGQQFNPECIKCHTTGFRQANGFYTITHSPSQQMINVQCEVCHGPAYEHSEAQMKIAAGAKNWMQKKDYAALLKHEKDVIPTAKVPEAVCLKCHTPENDGHFVYAEKIGKVNHKGAEAKPVR